MKDIILFTDSILYSYAQIFFSSRRWHGAIILAASFFNVHIGLMALLGATLVNTAAMMLKFDSEKIRTGFYGFNGLLFAAATLYYFKLDYTLLAIIPVFVLFAFILTAVIEHYFASAMNLPGLSLPFIATLYIFITFLANFPAIKAVQIHFELSALLPKYIALFFHSLGFIILQSNILSGILLAVGLLFFSRVLFLLSISSFAFSVWFTLQLFPNAGDNHIFLTGVNGILIGIALGGSLIIPSRKSFVLALLAGLLNVIMCGFFSQLFKNSLLPIIVLPFNFVTLLTIYSLKFRQSHSGLTLLYFQPGTPEENHYYHKNKKARFTKFKLLFPELPVFGEWTVSQGFDGDYTHKENWRWAWDFVVKDERLNECSGDGKKLEQFYCWKLPVVAPLDGKIVRIINGIPDNEIGDVNTERNWGNTIIIEHPDSLHSAFSHLEDDSIKVKVGDYVEQGQMIAACGNSGRSPAPHLHFQFQLNDTVGSHTHQFPFAHYIERLNGELWLRSFEFPKQEAIVQNLELSKPLKKAFDFKLGNTFKLHGSIHGKPFEEEWEVFVTVYNTLYIKSSKQASVSIYTTPKVFYLTDYVGGKDCALYYFYLVALQMPLVQRDNLRWSDSISPALFPTGFSRYLSEFFILFGDQLNVRLNFQFAGNDASDDLIVKSKIEYNAGSLFSFMSRDLEGTLQITQDGAISGFSVSEAGKEIFTTGIKLT